MVLMETLEYLFNKGYYIIIATNGPKVATRNKLVKIIKFELI